MIERRTNRKGLPLLVSGLVGCILAACSGDVGDNSVMGPADDADDMGLNPDAVGDDDATGPDGPDDTTPDDATPDDTDDSPGEAMDHGPPITAAALACDAAEVGQPTLRLLTRFEFANTIQSIFPQIGGQWTNTLSSDSLTESGFDNSAAKQLGQQQAERLLETAQSIGTAVAGDALAQILPCSTAAADRSCAQDYLATTGRRLFRRPLTGAESDRYLALFDTALGQTDFATAVKWVTVGLVQSPHAVYRSELGTVAGTSRMLSPYELATELAYTYTSTTPSAELLAQAESGSLGDLQAAARALLNTEAGRASLLRFFDSYVGYRYAGTIEKTDATGYGQVKADMVAETTAFLEHVLFDAGGGIKELLTSRSTYPSSQLASFYGLAAPAADFAEVERPAGQGVGLLAQGAFLAAEAGPDASSPTKRGLFTTERLLCQTRPPLPDKVPELVAVEPGSRTTRQRYEELHAGSGACAGCHALFDPIGFAFEHFDEAGRYRADEDGLPIDSSGDITLGTVGSLSFSGQEDLMDKLVATPTVHECFSAYLATFAFGTSDSCLGSSQTDALIDGSVGVADAFAALASEPHFAQRKAQ